MRYKVASRAQLWVIEHRLIILVMAILGVAAIVRLLTFARYLPYIEHPDEPVYRLLVRNWRGITHDAFVEYHYGTFPPAYPLVNWGIQLLVETFSGKPWILAPDYSYALRLFAALVGIATTGVIMSAAWQLAGPLAGLFAGLLWGLTPVIVDNNSLALPDPLVYLGMATAFGLAVMAWRRQSPRWLFASLLAGLIVIYLKYTPIGVLVPWGIVALLLLIKQPRRMIPWLLAQIAVSAAAAWLLIAYGALSTPSRWTTDVRFNASLMFDLERNINNWSFAISPIGSILFFAVILVAIVAYRVSRYRGWRTVSLLWVGICVLSGIVGIMMTTTYTHISPVKIRHALPITVTLIILWSMALAQVCWTLRSWWRERVSGVPGKGAEADSNVERAASKRANRLVWGMAALLAVGIAVPALAEDYRLIQQYQSIDIHRVIWAWADSSLPTDGLFLTDSSSYTEDMWNREWSGYDGVKSFQWWFEPEPTSSPAEYVTKKGITYFMISQKDLTRLYTTPTARAFIDQLTLIKEFTLSPGYHGDNVYFYRMLPPEVAINFNFGDQIVLVGYDTGPTPASPMDITHVKAGDTIQLRPYWRIRNRPTTNYSVFTHLYPEDSLTLLAQDDGPPVSVERATLTWDDPNELFIGRNILLTVPKTLKPGAYRLVIGLYDYVTGQRLLNESGQDSFSIEITVAP